MSKDNPITDLDLHAYLDGELPAERQRAVEEYLFTRPDEAERLADRVAVLRQSLIAVDTPTALRQRLFGARSIVQLANPDPRFIQAARTLPGAQHAELVDGELRVDWADTATSDGLSPVARHNPALIAALVAQGAEIQFVTEARASLEQVYLELVGQQG